MTNTPTANNLIVIGITGPAGSGKDTAANLLVALHGFQRIALADGVKSAFDDLSGPTYALHKDLSDTFTQRRAWQLLGTECRMMIGAPKLWIDLAVTKIAYLATTHPRTAARFVIPDVSYPHEQCRLIDAIQSDLGGTYETWRINRSGIAPIKDEHTSEAGRRSIPCDQVIFNDGDIGDLLVSVSAMLHAITNPQEAPTP